MKRFVIIIALILLSSCATTHRATEHVPPAGGEYVTASWYGQDFHGRPTSCGERYDMYGLTAAHKTMKFGTRLHVTNPDNNKSVDLTVNDRGPFIPGRDLDLSYGAAKAIGMDMKGVGRVKIEYLDRDMRYVKRLPYEPTVPTAPEGTFTIQAGSFIEQDNALRLKQGLLLSYNDVFITTANVNGQKFFRVRVGRFNTYDSAYSVASKLSDEGYSTFITARN